MKQFRYKKPTVGLLMATLLMGLSGCQTTHKLEADPNVEGKLKQPENAQEIKEKIDNVNARQEKINAYLAEAELAWQNENFAALEKIYAALEDFDPGNLRAKDGFKQIEFAKKHQKFLAEANALIGEDEANNELATAKLHEILLENPYHQEALRQYDALLEDKEKETRASLIKKLKYNRNVTMEFREVPIKKVFEGLSQATKINFILDKDVPAKQKATIFVKNMAFKDAFDLLLQTNKLAKKVLSDDTVIIYVDDQLRRRMYQDLIVRSYVLDYADAKHVSAVLRNMLGINKVEFDERLNTLIIKDSAEVLALAEKVIRAQDFPDAEVMLEVQIMEVRRTFLENLGTNPPTGLTLPVPGTGPLTIKDLKVSGKDIEVNGVPSVVFNTSNGNVSLLANPKIRVKNKETAKIHIGEKVPVFTSSVSSTGVASQSVQYIDAGVKFEVEPKISSFGDVTIKLNLNVSSIGDKVTATTGDSQSVAFRVGERFTSTTLRLHDGETQVLAGLIDDQDRQNVSGLPWLSKFPIVGRLFSNHADDKNKTEIVMSITPHIIRGGRMPTATQSEMWIGSDGRKGRRSTVPKFNKGESPFFIPKPATKEKAPANNNAPTNIDIKVPKSFSLGNGLGN